jgi:hypothetical protein
MLLKLGVLSFNFFCRTHTHAGRIKLMTQARHRACSPTPERTLKIAEGTEDFRKRPRSGEKTGRRE